MISAIKKEKNECFIGAMQFLFWQKWGKYLPDKIIKDYFNYSQKGISLKSVKENIEKIGGSSKIYYANLEELKSKKWYMIMIKKDDYLHYVCIKRIGRRVKCFDPVYGYVNIKIDDEIIVLDIEFKNSFSWEIPYDFNNGKIFTIFLLFISLFSTFLAIALSFYFKFALIEIQNKDLEALKNIIIIFASIGLINLFWTFIKESILKNILWKKIDDYFKHFIHYLLSSNEKIKTQFSKMQIYNSIGYGVDFLKYNMIEKAQTTHKLFVALTCGIVLYYEFKILILWIILFNVASSLLSAFFKKRLFNLQERIRLSDIDLANHILKAINNISIASGFQKEKYESVITKKFSKNIFLNKKNTYYNQRVSTKYSFIAWLFNVIISGLLFITITKDELSLPSGVYLITISTMLYSNLIEVWMFMFNHNIELDALNKFSDFVCNYKNDFNTISYDGSKTYENKFRNIKGHFQIKGTNGIGKTTYLKLYCGLFENADKKKIYLDKDTRVLGEPKHYRYQKLNIEEYYVKGDFVSSGQQQIKNLFLTLENKFDSLVIDEALCSVDLKIRNKLYKYLLETYNDKTILIVDHDVGLKIEAIDIML